MCFRSFKYVPVVSNKRKVWRFLQGPGCNTAEEPFLRPCRRRAAAVVSMAGSQDSEAAAEAAKVTAKVSAKRERHARIFFSDWAEDIGVRRKRLSSFCPIRMSFHTNNSVYGNPAFTRHGRRKKEFPLVLGPLGAVASPAREWPDFEYPIVFPSRGACQVVLKSWR